MVERFKDFIQANKLFNVKKDRLLLAVSGGVDSVVLVHLCKQLGVDVGIAHYNHLLRGEESQRDEDFVRQLADSCNVRFHVCKFDIAGYVEKNPEYTIQSAARDFRYGWLEYIRMKHRYTYIVTAHHHNDNVETFIQHVLWGCGMRGLLGIQAKREKEFLIRPLLWATKSEVVGYAREHGLEWVEDSSNASDKYQRNAIRHSVVPALEAVSADFEQTMFGNFARWAQADSLHKWALGAWYERCWQPQANGDVHIYWQILPPAFASLALYEWLSPMGFRNRQVQTMLSANTGASWFNANIMFDELRFQVRKERDFLHLYQPQTLPSSEVVIYEDSDVWLDEFTRLLVEIKPYTSDMELDLGENVVVMDADKLRFPLLARHWRQGDSFLPFGMGGKRQLLSDYFKNNRLTATERLQIWLVESGDSIVWVAGWRMSELVRVSEATRRVAIVEVVEL